MEWFVGGSIVLADVRQLLLQVLLSASADSPALSCVGAGGLIG